MDEGEEVQSTIAVLIEKRKAIMKVWAAVWICTLIMAFSAIVTVRAAIGLPLF